MEKIKRINKGVDVSHLKLVLLFSCLCFSASIFSSERRRERNVSLYERVESFVKNNCKTLCIGAASVVSAAIIFYVIAKRLQLFELNRAYRALNRLGDRTESMLTAEHLQDQGECIEAIFNNLETIEMQMRCIYDALGARYKHG